MILHQLIGGIYNMFKTEQEAITYIEQLSTPNTKIQNLCKETFSEGYNPYHR